MWWVCNSESWLKLSHSHWLLLLTGWTIASLHSLTFKIFNHTYFIGLRIAPWDDIDIKITVRILLSQKHQNHKWKIRWFNLDSVSWSEDILHGPLKQKNSYIVVLPGVGWSAKRLPAHTRSCRWPGSLCGPPQRLSWECQNWRSTASSSWSWHCPGTSSWGRACSWRWTPSRRGWTGSRSRTVHTCSPRCLPPSGGGQPGNQSRSYHGLQPEQW